MNNIKFVDKTTTSFSHISEEELTSLKDAIDKELLKRERKNDKKERHNLSFKNSKEIYCPRCGPGVKYWLNGYRKSDRVRRYKCSKCKYSFYATSCKSLASVKLPLRIIKDIIMLVIYDLPDWVIAKLLHIEDNTVAFWRDRCLDAAFQWSKENKLKNRFWLDEMFFAPVRNKQSLINVKRRKDGSITKDFCISVAIDDSFHAFCRSNNKLGVASIDSILMACDGLIEEGSTIVHDGNEAHEAIVERYKLKNKAYQIDRPEYEKAMEMLNNFCAFIRYEFSKHKGIKADKIQYYANFFAYKYCHIHKYGYELTIEYLQNRVFGTYKSHKTRETFGKWY